MDSFAQAPGAVYFYFFCFFGKKDNRIKSEKKNTDNPFAIYIL